MIPPLPKNYDVENRGHFSAGRLYPTKKPKKTKAKPSTTVTFGNDVEGDDPGSWLTGLAFRVAYKPSAFSCSSVS